MSQPIVQVRNISKRFQIGMSGHARVSLRDAFSRVIRLPTDKRSKAALRRQNEFFALQDISFEVAQGEVIGIIGRNGAGKSTLLRILASIIKPTAGEIDIFGSIGSL